MPRGSGLDKKRRQLAALQNFRSIRELPVCYALKNYREWQQDNPDYQEPTGREIDEWMRSHPELGPRPRDKVPARSIYKHHKYLRYLLTNKELPSINCIISDRGANALIFACTVGLADMAMLICLQPLLDVNYQQHTSGATAAHHAVCSGNTACITALSLRPEIDWNIRSNDNMTPAAYSILNCDTAMVETLAMQEGVDWNVQDDAGNTLAMVNIGLRNKTFGLREGDLSLEETREERLTILKIMAKIAGIDWNKKNKDGLTPALAAVKMNNTEFVRVLVEIEGINWNFRAKKGKNVLIFALENENYEILKMLFKLPNLEYKISDLRKGNILATTIQKCLEIVTEEQKETGINYSDVNNFLNAALKEADRVKAVTNKKVTKLILQAIEASK